MLNIQSVQAEPPSICDTDMEDMINNTTDNQLNDEFPSDYCDDFEEYESDFEDDDDQQEEEEQEEEELEVNLHQQKLDIPHNLQDLYKRKDTSMEIYDNHKNNKILPQSDVIEVRETSHKSEVTPILISNMRPNQSFTHCVQSAKIRSQIEIERNKTIKRSKELLDIIKLDEISFTNFDLPQINYELYIKTFGRKDSKQVSCQTSERENSETQTDFIQMSDKWTQNPSFTRLVAGNQNQMNEETLSNDFEPNVNPFELMQFLTKAETLMSAIIDIEFDNQTNSKRSLPKGTEMSKFALTQG